jgi:lipopolysaccharide biosynthesis glycosyltransferase
MDLVIVFAINDAYCLPLLVALRSIAVSNPALVPRLQVVVLHESLADDTRHRIRRAADRLGMRVEIRRVDLPAIGYQLAYGGSRGHYLRLTMGRVLSDHGRILYLDADIIVRGDIEPLLRTDLQGRPIAAVRDATNPVYAGGIALPGWQDLGIPADREYFNSGVLVIDLNRCRQEEIFERCFAFIERHPEHLRLWDQDALNRVLEDRWVRLDRLWNTFPLSSLLQTEWMRYNSDEILPLSTLFADEPRARILHYVSPAKPWLGLMPPGWATDLYRDHQRASGAIDAHVEAARGGPPATP